MAKFATTYPLVGLVGFKVLAYEMQTGNFISPSRTSFIWTNTLMEAVCTRPQYRDGSRKQPDDGHRAGGENCWCGFHVTYQYQIALDYTNASQISPMFLLEASGMTTPHRNGYRSEEVYMRGVVLPSWSNDASTAKATYIAADRFKIPVLNAEEAQLMVDIWNFMLLPNTYVPEHAELKGLTKESLLALANSLYS